MKTRLLIVLLMLGTIVQAQDKWRTLTIGATNMSVAESGTQLTSFSAGLDFELGKGWWISSWNQLQLNHRSGANWFATASTIDRRFDSGITVGVGYLYFEGNQGQVAYAVPTEINNALITKVTYRIKL